MKKVLLGNEAIIKGALATGVSFVSGYPGCPSAEIGDGFAKIAKENGIYAEWSTNEKVALEAAIGASFSGLKSLVNMKSFGINVASDILFPLAYTGVKAGMVIFVGDDPSCYSSAQSEQDSRGYAYLAKIPVLDPSTPQECYDFTKIGFEISEKFKVPIILRVTTRVAHQRAPVVFEISEKKEFKKGEFVKNPHQYLTMPPRVMEMKNELLEKIKKIQAYEEKSELNKASGKPNKIGIITTGISYLHVLEALEELKLDLPILKLGFFYPLPKEKISKFIKPLKKVLVVEELDPYLEREIIILAKAVNPKIEIFGKNLLPQTGELDSEKVCSALAKLTGKKFSAFKIKTLDLPKRTARLCDGCPYWYILPTIKRIAPEGTIFGGDIGCNMMGALPPHSMYDYMFCMGSSIGISHGISKAINPHTNLKDDNGITSSKSEAASPAINGISKPIGKIGVGASQKVISFMGDGTFFHSGIEGMINAVYNKSNPLMIVMDNRITAMTGHQPNPGMGKTSIGEDTYEIQIADVAKACGVKNIKVLDPINIKELEETVKEFLENNEVSVIICKRICALLERKLKKQKNGK